MVKFKKISESQYKLSNKLFEEDSDNLIDYISNLGDISLKAHIEGKIIEPNDFPSFDDFTPDDFDYEFEYE